MRKLAAWERVRWNSPLRQARDAACSVVGPPTMEEHLAASVAISLANASAEARRTSGVATPLCGAVDAKWVAEQRRMLNQSRSELSGLQDQLRFSTELGDELEHEFAKDAQVWGGKTERPGAEACHKKGVAGSDPTLCK